MHVTIRAQPRQNPCCCTVPASTCRQVVEANRASTLRCHSPSFWPSPGLPSRDGLGAASIFVPPMHIRYFGHTDTGLSRDHNEDSHLADPDLGVFVVADGVGGRAKGEVASQETVELIWEWLKRNEVLIRDVAEGNATERAGQLCQVVRGAIQNACYMVHSMGELDPDQRGMSTTASVFLVCGNVGVVGQVGDSRVYLVRENEVAQLTEDHTLINY